MAERFVKYISAKPGKPQMSFPALGAVLAYVWLSIAGASVRAARVLPMLVGPYCRLPALHGARIQPRQAPMRYHNITEPPHPTREIGPAQLAQTLWGSAFIALNPHDHRWRKIINRLAKII